MSTTQNNPSRAVTFGNDSLGRSVQMSSTNELHHYHTRFDDGQSMKTSQQDELMNLKIRIAVLESELAHARKEKEDGLLGLRVVVESLTRHAASAIAPAPAPALAALPSSQHDSSQCAEHALEKKQLEAEIKRLRRENRSLKERSQTAHAEHGEISAVLKTPVHDSERSLFRTDYRDLQNVPNGPRQHHHKPAVKPHTSSAVIEGWGHDQILDDHLPTGPNLPVPPRANLPLRNFDVGCYSLEENLDDDGPPRLDLAKVRLEDEGFPASLVAPIAPEGQQKTVPSNEYPELEKGIDEQLAEQNEANLDFVDPSPSVLKIGFQVGGKLGGEYDPSNMLEAPRTYKRSGCLWREPSSAEQSHGNVRATDTSFNSKLWDSFEDREGAIQANMRLAKGGFRRGGESERAFPDIFRHGIQYRPEETDSNYLRTVLITNLPPDTEIREVLARVRGGEILHATMLNTMKITESMSAKVVFFMEGAAEDYVSYAADHPIAFGEERYEADVELINTPTYPLNPRRSQSLREREQTRCIAIPDFPEDISLSGLERTLACGNGYRAESLVEFYIDEAGTLHFEFSSVGIAGSAFGILTSRRIYGGSFPMFEADPCAGPLEELENDIPQRPPMLPRNGRPRPTNQSANTNDRGSLVVGQVEDRQRKQLAALNNQKVEIPSFSGAGIKSSSWADEVIDEADETDQDISPIDLNSPPATTLSYDDRAGSGDQQSAANGIKDPVDTKPREGLKRHVGLAGSKYASLVPDFEDRGERPRLGRGGPARESFDNIMAASTPLGRERTANGNGLDLHTTQELARQADDESERKFNTFTRQSSPEDIDGQNSQLNPQQVFHSQESVGLSENRFSRSPPRVNLDSLLASSESSVSNPQSPALPPPFDISAFEIVESTSSSAGEKAVKAVHDDSTENKSLSTESEPCSPKTLVLKLRTKKNVTFDIPASDELDGAGKQAGLGLSIGGEAKRKRDYDAEIPEDVMEATGNGPVINPDEISLDDDE